MAPKNKRPEEPKEKKVAKAKAQKDKKAKDEPQNDVLAVPDPSVPSREETSAFLTALKYKAKNVKDPAKEGAAAILEVGFASHKLYSFFLYICILLYTHL